MATSTTELGVDLAIVARDRVDPEDFAPPDADSERVCWIFFVCRYRRVASDLAATLPLRARTGSTFRMNPVSVVDGIADPLLAAKVSFGGLHRQSLDPVSQHSCGVSSSGAAFASIRGPPNREFDHAQTQLTGCPSSVMMGRRLSTSQIEVVDLPGKQLER